MPNHNAMSRVQGATLTTFDKPTGETTTVNAPLVFIDDFLGKGNVTFVSTAVGGLEWTKKIVVTSGTAAVAGAASAIGGQISLSLDATSEKQDAAFYWGDQKGLDATKGLGFEARFRLSVLPSASGVQAIVGVASDWIDGPDNNTCYLEVGATASGALLVRSYDGVTTISAASGVTLLATDWAIVRIDASDVTDVKIFIGVNGAVPAQVTTTGQINFAATSTLAVLQPMFQVYKPSGTGVATLLVDYCKTWSNRA